MSRVNQRHSKGKRAVQVNTPVVSKNTPSTSSNPSTSSPSNPSNPSNAINLHHIPLRLHRKLSRYLSVGERSSLVRVNSKLRSVYQKYLYERCYFYDESDIKLWSPSFYAVPVDAFIEPDKYKWFHGEHVKIIVFTDHAIGTLVDRIFTPAGALTYCHLPIYFPNLRHVFETNGLRKRDWNMEMLTFLGTAPNVFLYKARNTVLPALFNKSVRWIDFAYGFIPTNISDFKLLYPNLSYLTINATSENITPQFISLIKSIAKLPNLKYFDLGCELCPNIGSVLEAVPKTVPNYILTLYTEDGLAENYLEFLEKFSSETMDLRHVTHFKYQCDYECPELMERLMSKAIFSNKCLRTMSLGYHAIPSIIANQLDQDQYRNLTRLSIHKPVRLKHIYPVRKLEKLVNLKYLTASFPDDSYITFADIQYSHGMSVIRSFINDIRTCCWNSRSKTYNFYKPEFAKTLQRPYYNKHPAFLESLVHKTAQEIVSIHFPLKSHLFNEMDQMLVLRCLEVFDMLRLARVLPKLERLEIFESLYVLDSLVLLPLIYEHKTLKSIMFTEFIELIQSEYKPRNLGFDKKHQCIQECDGKAVGVIDVEGIRNGYERNSLRFVDDQPFFYYGYSSQDNFLSFDTVIFHESGLYGTSPFEEVSNLADYEIS